MKATLVPVLLAASLLIAVAGCASPAPAITDDPVVSAPSEAPAPDAKPTAAPPAATCFIDDFAMPAEDVRVGGAVTWPTPLVDDAIGVEPSCWADQLDTEVDLFLAGWFGLDDAQYDSVNGPIETALQDAGFELTDDTDGISRYQLKTGDNESLGYQITRTDGYYELAVTIGRG